MNYRTFLLVLFASSATMFLPIFRALKSYPGLVELLQNALRGHNILAPAAIVLFWAVIIPLTHFTWRLLSKRQSVSPGPPRLFETLLWIISSAKARDAVIGDLSEIYDNNVRKHGVAWARLLYRWDVIRSIHPLLWTWVRRIAGGAAFIRHFF